MRRPLAFLALALAAALMAGGCGSAEEGTEPVAQPEPMGRPADFPRARGGTMAALGVGSSGGRSLVFSPSVKELRRGVNRYGFALFDTARKQVTGAKVALYIAREDGSQVRGPFIARSESLKVDGPFQSQTTASDPEAAKAIYVADVPFRRRGRHVVTAIAKLDGRLVGTNGHTVEVDRRGAAPPDIGEPAIRVHTRTLADVGGDASAIDTRVPPAKDLLRHDLAEVLGRKPVVLTFATPALCVSRVCAPVVDIVQEAKSRAPAGIAFIHQEIYRDNEVNKGVQPPVTAWHLPSEPWTFVIDREGRVAARFEGPFSVGELQRAIAKVNPRRAGD